MTTETVTPARGAILDGLRKLIGQRSGIDRRNYQRDYRDADGYRAFQSDYRRILRDGRDARTLLRFVELRESITADAIAERSRGGRLELSADRRTWHYTAGQYFAVEYRAAVCRLLAGVIWDYLRESGYATADDMRKAARLEFGRGIAGRWFA